MLIEQLLADEVIDKIQEGRVEGLYTFTPEGEYDAARALFYIMGKEVPEVRPTLQDVQLVILDTNTHMHACGYGRCDYYDIDCNVAGNTIAAMCGVFRNLTGDDVSIRVRYTTEVEGFVLDALEAMSRSVTLMPSGATTPKHNYLRSKDQQE